jgi:WD40 repeat protein
LTWFDRAGKLLEHVGPPGAYNNVALSADGTRAAVMQRDAQGNADIWLLDLARGIPTRFTFDPAMDWDPVWSPDGRRIAFSSSRDGQFNIYTKDSSGAATEQRLLKSDLAQRPTSWSSDGHLLLFTQTSKAGTAGLWVLPENGKPEPYLQSAFNQTHGQFLPEAAGPPHWVAYTSNEAGGLNEVFVQSFPTGAGKFQISNGGGSQPRWRRDGKELFYIGGAGELMAVDIRTVPKFEAGIPQPLFDPKIAGGVRVQYVFRYDVTPDGKRFLVNCQPDKEQAAASFPITVVLNWNAGLKQ